MFTRSGLSLTFGILFTFAFRVNAHNCGSALVAEDRIATTLRFLHEATDTSLINFGQQLLLRENSDFARYLADRGLVWEILPDGSKYRELGIFFEARLGDYSPAALRSQREAQLLEELRHRGFSFGGTGYEALRELSRQNRQRLEAAIGGATVVASEIEGEISGALRGLEILFVHNTTSLQRRPTMALLSARELSAVGISSKLNTKPFNQDILKTDGNVYFFAIPHIKGKPLPKVGSAYGNVSLILDAKYAADHGWMSPFVMYPQDLRRLDLPVDQLHRLDMQPGDYLEFLKAGIAAELHRRYLSDPASYARGLEALRSGDGLLSLIEGSLARAGIPVANIHDSLELKVPVAVAVEALTMHFDANGLEMGASAAPPPIPKGPMLQRMRGDDLF